VLLVAAESAGGDAAVIDAAVTVSYGALAARSLSFASTVTEAGVRPGDRVAVLLRRNAVAAAASFGTLAAGAVVVTDQLRPRQIEHILGHSGSSVLLSAAEMIDRLPRRLETKAVVTDADEVPATGSATPVPRVGGDVAQVVCTSRSTGLPKGVTFSHANLWAGCIR
jgi:acyl-CoA synthetase (AMP-forming)/AMP-acid ligase II